MTVQEAVKFCKMLAKDPEFVKQYADANEFNMQDVIDMLNDYAYMKDRYYKYEYICNMMSSDEYCELASMYENESGEEEDD